QSELLDEIVSAKPALDHTRYHSAEELKEAGLQHLCAAAEVVEQKAPRTRPMLTSASCSISPAESRRPTENTERVSATPSKPLSTRSRRHSPRHPPSLIRPPVGLRRHDDPSRQSSSSQI